MTMENINVSEELLKAFQQLHDASHADGEVVKEPRIQSLLTQLHVGDIANFIETIPPDWRILVWQQMPPEMLAPVFSDMAESAAAATAKEVPNDVLAGGLQKTKDLDDACGLLRCLPPKRRTELLRLSGRDNDLKLLKSLSYAPDTVGEIMDFSYFSMRSECTVADAVAHMRKEKIPSHCDKLFVTTANKFVGIVPLKRLITRDSDAVLGDIMVTKRLRSFRPEMAIEDAAEHFERYDLLSVPVINHTDELLARVTIDEILYFYNHDRYADLLSSSGLQDEEDLYAPIITRLKNRGSWVFINLVAAFLISLMIGTFEATIAEVVALAALMPIVSNLAGNTGMQTATLVIRGLAFNQIKPSNWHSFLGRELLLACVNGMLWGVLVGLFGLMFYQDIALALVLTGSMAVVFLLGALTGFLVPVIVNMLHKDPALGTAVVVTTVTDCLAFFIFLGLATIYLV